MITLCDLFLDQICGRTEISENSFIYGIFFVKFCSQEKEAAEEDEEDDTFDMDIKVTDPEKIGRFAFPCFSIC